MVTTSSKRSTKSAASFDDFFAAFSKSVQADVQLRDGEIVLSHSGGLLNDALAGPAAVYSPAAPSLSSSSSSRPVSRASPVKTLPPLSRGHQRQQPQQQQPQTKPPPATGIDVPLPAHLAALVALQATDGSWRFDDKFTYVVNGIAAPPVDGISPKLWATAIVVTICRQSPEFFQQLEAAYEKAMLHVDDHVLHLVQDKIDLTALNQIRPYQNNEAKEIRDRLAREAAAHRAEEEADEKRLALERETAIKISNYSMARTKRLPLETQELFISALSSDVQAIFPVGNRKPPKMLKPQEMQIHVGDTVECCWRRVDGSTRPQVRDQWWRGVVKAQSGDGKSLHVEYLDEPFERQRNVLLQYVRLSREDAQQRRARAFGSLKETWENALPMREELDRLHGIEDRRKWRKPWEVRSLQALPVCVSSTEKEDVHRSPQKQQQQHQQQRTREMATTTPGENSNLASDELYQRAVSSVLVYDKLLERLRKAIKQAARQYSSATLFRERFQAFNGFLDIAVQLVTQTVDVLERIQAWVESGLPQQEEGAVGETTLRRRQRRPRMFVWRGHDFVLSLLRSLDFLGSHKAVVEWYGDDFAFSMNPLLMGQSIRDLATDNGLGFSTDKLGVVEPENALRITLRMHKGEIATHSASVPTWWPESRYDPTLRTRIKSVEEFILRYLQATEVFV